MTLKITIADAMIKHNTEPRGFVMKPYVIIHTRDSEFKTRLSSGSNPSWGDTVLVSEREQDLTIEVFDIESGIDDTIGRAYVKIRSLIGQPYVPVERVVDLIYQHGDAGQIRLIVEYIEGKEHVGGLAPFQSRLNMTGQPLRGDQRMVNVTQTTSTVQQIIPPMQIQPVIPQQYNNSFPQQYSQPTSQVSQINQLSQMPYQPSSQVYIQQPGQYPVGNSNLYNPMAGGSLAQQQMNSAQFSAMPFNQGQTGLLNTTEFVNGTQTLVTETIVAPRIKMTDSTTSPMMFNAYNPMTATGQPALASSVTIPRGTPSMINQSFGTHRIPILKGQYNILNWFSILDQKGIPHECMPARLI